MDRDYLQRIRRRDFLRLAGVTGSSLALAQLAAACAVQTPAAPPTAVGAPTSVAVPTAVPATAAAALRTNLRVGQFAEPPNLDPFLTTNVEQGEVQYNLFTPLVHLDYKTLQPAPALATAWEQPDPLTWRFKLREGVQFHKGYGEVTASDVAFNANYTIEENKPRKFLYFFVENAKAIDKYTVEFKLSQPFTPFLVTTAADQGTWVVSEKAYKEIGADAFGRNPVGSGPFEFVSWEPGSAITLKKFDKYWQPDRPYLQEIVYHPVPDTNVKMLQLVNGELDFIDQPDFKDIPQLEADPNITVAKSPGWSWNAIVFNMKLPADHPLMKKEVRQAIGYAIDRDEIAKSVYFGNSVADDNPLPPGYLATDPGVHLYGTKANLEKAKELMAQAGVTGPITVNGIVSVKPAMRRQMEIIASQLAKIGITINIEQLPGDVFERMGAGKFDLGLMDITVMTPDPDSALYWFQRSGTVANYGYANAVADQLLDQARVEADKSKRAAIYQQVLETILADAPYIFTVHRGMVWAYNKKLTGFEPRPQDYLLDFENVRWTA